MNILFVQILRMGDAVQLLPTVKGLKERFPQSRVCVLTSNLGAKVFEGVTDLDHVYVFQKAEIVDLLRTGSKENTLAALDILQKDLEQVGSVEWDWIINLGYTFSSALLTHLLDARNRSGFVITKDRQYGAREKWFSYSLASFVTRRYSNFNWVDINRNILGLPGVPHSPLLAPDKGSLAGAAVFFHEKGLENRRLAGFHPGASGPHKMWSLRKFAELGASLATRHDFTILIFGGRREEALCEQLKDLIGDRAHNLAGKTSIDELKAYLSLCEFLITNDTGPMHIASAVGTRVIGLFFSTHFVETGPYGEGHVVIHPAIPCFPCQGTGKCQHKECLTYISPETVECVALNERDLREKHGEAFLKADRGKVRVYFSDFDPWGNLDWHPLDRNPLTFDAVERKLLKVSWLSHSGNINGTPGAEEDYLRKALSYYSPPLDKTMLFNRLQGLRQALETFNSGLQRASSLALSAQSQFLGPCAGLDIIRELGGKLADEERDTFSGVETSCLSFLGELSQALLENIEKTDFLKLTTRTLAVYLDMISFAEIMMNRSEKMARLISDTF